MDKHHAQHGRERRPDDKTNGAPQDFNPRVVGSNPTGLKAVSGLSAGGLTATLTATSNAAVDLVSRLERRARTTDAHRLNVVRRPIAIRNGGRQVGSTLEVLAWTQPVPHSL
jgi:hypothetical protein